MPPECTEHASSASFDCLSIKGKERIGIPDSPTGVVAMEALMCVARKAMDEDGVKGVCKGTGIPVLVTSCPECELLLTGVEA